MATNSKIAWTRSASLPVPTDRASGTAVLSGATAGRLHGVLLTDEGAGGNADGYATVALDGSFDLPVTTTTTMVAGQPVYIIPATHVLTPSATDNDLFGYAMEAKSAANPETIEVMIASQV